MITVYPIGTTIYDPDKCCNGYTLYCFPHEPEVRLVDMNGGTVNEWGLAVGRAKLLKNGNLLVVEDGLKTRKCVQEYSWNGDLVWQYEPEIRAHHDAERLSNGNTLVICNERVPEECRQKIENPVRKTATQIFGDVVLEVTRDNEIVWEWHTSDHLDINRYCEICNFGDWTHMNTVQALPENRHYDGRDNRFKPGNVLLSPRNLSCIFIVDKDTKEIVWEYSGSYAGGLAGQHEPHMIEKGLPGEGNIIIFDNGAPPYKNLVHTGSSYILEIDPPTQRLVWKYENTFRNRSKFFSAFKCNVQRLPNGNTLICESDGPRIFEVTPECEIVWEFAFEWDRSVGRAYRYPYDYCPQLRDLDKPKEERVVPPPHVRTRPHGLEMPGQKWLHGTYGPWYLRKS